MTRLQVLILGLADLASSLVRNVLARAAEVFWNQPRQLAMARYQIQRFAAHLLPAAFLLLPLGQLRLSAMPPPTPDMVKQYKADGTWKKRLEQAKKIGNHRADPGLIKAARQRLMAQAKASGVALPGDARTQPTPPTDWRGMPTKGTPKMFVLLIDFSDYPADPVNTPSAIHSLVFDDGDGTQAAPYESLKSFYYRSSYGQLTLSGNVLAYYRPNYTRASMGDNPTDIQRENLIKEALQAQVSHDFSQYDNNGDGVIDYFAVLWTGPDNGWANFWWAYQTSWSESPSPVLNGKTLGKYVWEWVSNAAYPTRNAPHFDPWILIHETGHALGLPDYYDYDASVGPKGGIGGLDIMDSNWGDHNCFSKWILDWITPTIYTSAAPGVALYAAGSMPEAAVIMDINPGSSFGEFFMVQNRQRVQNDAGVNYPADGLLIWHVDSRLNALGSDYLYDNSYTAHKLLRLMEADGLEEIETYSASANAGDYWTTGTAFSPAGVPNSTRYDGSVSGMGVKNISAPGALMTFDVSQVIDPTPPTGQPTAPTATTDQDTMTFTWTIGTAADDESGISGYRLRVGTALGGSDVFTGYVGNVLTYTLNDLGLKDGLPLYAQVVALNGTSLSGNWSNSSAPLAISLPTFDRAVLDNTDLTFKTLGPWFPTASTSYLGGSCAQSAAIPNNSRTYLQSRVFGPGTIQFYWKVNSEQDYDYLTFSIDGVAQPGKISGATSFAQQLIAIPTGTHVIRWTYKKDIIGAPANDAAWVDAVSFTPSAMATIQPATWTTLTGAAVPFSADVINTRTSNSVIWSINPADGSFNPAQTTSGSATILTASNSPGTYTVTATPVESPNVPGTAQLNLVDTTSVNVAVVGSDTTVTVNVPVTFTATVTPLTSNTVTWTKSGGTFGTQTGTTTNWSSASVGTFILTATSTVATGCTGSTTVTVTEAPPSAPVITAPASAVPGATGLIASVQIQPGSTYAWTITNGVITSGQNTNSITFTAGALGDLVLGCTVTNASGTSSAPGTTTVAVLDLTAITLDHSSATLVSGASINLVGTTQAGTILWGVPLGQGTLSATTTASGVPNTYKSPANLLGDLTASVTLTNATNSAQTATATLTIKTLDVNRDALFDLQDLLTLALDWGTTASRSRLSGSTAAGEADLALLLTALGF